MEKIKSITLHLKTGPTKDIVDLFLSLEVMGREEKTSEKMFFYKNIEKIFDMNDFV